MATSVPFTHTLYFKLGRLLLFVLALLFATQVGIMALLWRGLMDAHNQQVNWEIAENLKQHILDAIPGENRSFGDLLRVQRELRDFNPSAEIYLIKENGDFALALTPSSSYRRPEHVDPAPLREFVENLDTSRAPLYMEDPGNDDRRVVFSAARMTFSGESLYLVVALDTWRTGALFELLGQRSVLRLSAALVFFSFFVTLIVGLASFFMLTKRFSHLTEIVREFAARKFDRRVPVSSDDEVGVLSAAVNTMADTIQENFVQLEERDRLRRELLANIWHDLRGPVGVIKGTSEQMSRMFQGPQAAARLVDAEPADAEDQLQVIDRSVVSLTQLLDELFELAKLEAKEMLPPKESFLLEQLLTDVSASFAGRAGQFNISLQHSGDDALPMVYGNIGLLERVLGNLLENAVRHTPSGGTITIDARVIEGRVRVAVQDTGVGIPPDQIDKVFDRFVRGDRAIAGRGESTGLGLAIVRKIVEEHGSQIRVQSEIGKGTEFYFELPIVDEQQAAAG